MPTEAEYQRLLIAADKVALRELVETYSRAIDRRDFDLLRSIYHEDAQEEHGGMFSGSVAAYVDWLPGVLAKNEATAHYVVNALFEIDGDKAQGETYKINYHRSLPPDSIETITGSRSHDRFERRNGVWKFSYRGIVLDWSTVRPVDPESYAQFAASSPPGKPDATDLSYQRLSLFMRGGRRR